METIEEPQNYYYDGDVRMVLAEDAPAVAETEKDFMLRMKRGLDVVWTDLTRAEVVLPIFAEAKLARKHIREAIEGIAAGGAMKEVIKGAGFPYWADFEAKALRRAPAVRALYLLAKKERERGRLNDAEDALHERAVEGVDEPIVNHLGKIVGYKKKFSDSLLTLQLKALNPDKYADKGKNQFEGVMVKVNMDFSDLQEKPAEEIEESPPAYAGLEGSDLSVLAPDQLGSEQSETHPE